MDRPGGSWEINPGGKILRYPQHIFTVLQGGVPPVMNVEIDLSEVCNAHCSYCDFPDRVGQFMSEETLGKVIALLNSWGTEAVVLTGGGEPTLHPNFEEMARRLSSAGFALGMYTNGIVDQSKTAGLFHWIYVSLDAANPKQWAEAKGVDASKYEVVQANISKYAAATTTGAGFLVGRNNWSSIAEMAESAPTATYVHFRPLWPYDPEGGWVSFAVAALAKAAKNPRVSVAWKRFDDALVWRRDYNRCWASMFIRQIDANGDVFVCPTTRWKRGLGSVDSVPRLRRPVLVTDECRELCRGHSLNQTMEYIASSNPHGVFI